MDFSTPATAPNPIDRGRIVTKPFDRIDGPLKVSGRAHYAYEFHEEFPNAAYGFVLGASIPRGKIVSIDVKQAEAAPGVLLVMTHLNAPKQDAEGTHNAPQLAGPEIEQAEQAVAFVVAESFEQARAAAKLIDIRYERGTGVPRDAQPLRPPGARLPDRLLLRSPIRDSKEGPQGPSFMLSKAREAGRADGTPMRKETRPWSG